MDQLAAKYLPVWSGGKDNGTIPAQERTLEETAAVSSNNNEFRSKWSGFVDCCCGSPSARLDCCCHPNRHLRGGRRGLQAVRFNFALPKNCTPSVPTFEEVSTFSNPEVVYGVEVAQRNRAQHMKTAVVEGEQFVSRYAAPHVQIEEKKQLNLYQCGTLGTSTHTAQQGLLRGDPTGCERNAREGWAQLNQSSSMLPSSDQEDLVHLLLALNPASGSLQPGDMVQNDHRNQEGRCFTANRHPVVLPEHLSSETCSAKRAEAVRMKDLLQQRRTLQTILYYYSQAVLSQAELHVLRHALCLERTGPLTECEASLLRKLSSSANINPLSLSERHQFVDLLRQRGIGAVSKEEEQILRTFLLRAVGSSLSFEQASHVNASLQEKHVTPFTRQTFERLHDVLNKHIGSVGDTGKVQVQAAIEDQLTHQCTLPQQLAVHRLLYMEQLWRLSTEQRVLLEMLQSQPPRWWSPEEEKRFFECLDRAHFQVSEAPGIREATRLLLQLLRASLTSSQYKYLDAILEMERGRGNTETEERSTGSVTKGAVPTASQVRLMSLMRRQMEREELTPADSRELQSGILQELVRLVPEEQFVLLKSLFLLNLRPPLTVENLQFLKELQLRHEMLKLGERTLVLSEHLDLSGLRKAFVDCLAMSLSHEQLSLLNHFLQRLGGEREGMAHPGLGVQGHLCSKLSSSAHQTLSVGGGIEAEIRPEPGLKGQQQHLEFFHPIHENSSVLGDVVRSRVLLDSTQPDSRVHQDKEMEATKSPQMPVGDSLTVDQAQLLERLLQLQHVGCLPPELAYLLTKLLDKGGSSGLASDKDQKLLRQLFFRQLSVSFSGDQLELIKGIVAEGRVPASRTSRQPCTYANQKPNPTTREGGMTDSPNDSFALTIDQRYLLSWLVEQHENEERGKGRQLVSSQFSLHSKHEGERKETQAPKHHILLRKLASSLSSEQRNIVLHLLRQDRSRTCQTEPSRRDAKGLFDCLGNDSTEVGVGLQDVEQVIKNSPFQRSRESVSGSEQQENADLSMHEASEVPGSLDVGMEESNSRFPTLLQQARERKILAVAPGAHKDFEAAVNQPDLVLVSGTCIHANAGDPTVITLEDLRRKRELVIRMAREAAEIRLFHHNLEMWRQQFKQRAQLYDVLKTAKQRDANAHRKALASLAPLLSTGASREAAQTLGVDIATLPFVAKIEALQSGYLKRCPCLYHQQQDKQENEEREANLRLLNSLGNLDFRPREQASKELAASGKAVDEGFLSDEHLDEDCGRRKKDVSEASVSPVAITCRSPAQGSRSSLVLDPEESETFVPTRKGSLPTSLLSGHSRYTVSPPGECVGSHGADEFAPREFAIPLHTKSLEKASVSAYEERSRWAATELRRARPGFGGSSMGPYNRGRSREGVSRSRRVGGLTGDQEIDVETRKKIMQRQALEKAQQLKKDAKVAAWIALMKQLQTEEPTALFDIVDKMNLSHLTVKSLPKGKAWKTRSLLSMVEAIVRLVCTLRGQTEATSTLAPLVALANRTRVEDCDLAIHAEVENARRALLCLSDRSSALNLEREMVDAGCLAKTPLKAFSPPQMLPLLKIAPPVHLDEENEDVMPEFITVKNQTEHQASKQALKSKSTVRRISAKAKPAAAKDKPRERKETNSGAPASPHSASSDSSSHSPNPKSSSESLIPRSSPQSPNRESSSQSPKVSTLPVAPLQPPQTPSSIREPRKTRMRVHRRSELIHELETRAQKFLQLDNRKKQLEGHFARSYSASALSTGLESQEVLIPREQLRRSFSAESYTRAPGRALRPVGPNGRIQMAPGFLEDNSPFSVLKTRLKRWLLGEAKGLDLVRGERMSYREWIAFYSSASKRGPEAEPKVTQTRLASRAPRVKMRMQRVSVSARPPVEQSPSSSSS